MKNLLCAMMWAPLVALAAVEPQSAVVPVESESPASEGVAVRNPFWPIGYEGKREVISAEVRVVPKKAEEVKKEKAEAEDAQARLEAAAKARAEAEAAAKARAEAEARERIILPEHWTAAYRALRIGGRVKAEADDGREASCVMINGKAYGDGDLVSFTHGKNRFTWRVQRLTDGKTVRLERVGARHLGKTSTDKDNSAKGVSK